MLKLIVKNVVLGSLLAGFTVLGNAHAGSESWQDIDLPLTQKQFCRVYQSNVVALNVALNSRNDIKINTALKNIEQDLISLLPVYQFENWVGKMSTVAQGKDGNVGVDLKLQCNLSLASGIKVGNTARRSTSITPDSRIYRELAKLDYDDYVLMSGTLIDFESGSSTTNNSKFTNSSSFIVDLSKLSKY
jgi:hypothetical protein